MGCFSGPIQSLNSQDAERLGFNRSALHWDLVSTGPRRVTAHLAGGGSMVLYENGQFTYDPEV